MLCSLFGNPRACGTVTTSATESVILACIGAKTRSVKNDKRARLDFFFPAYRHLAIRRGIRKPEIILCRNADITFIEAARLLHLRVVSIDMDANGEFSDLGALKRALSTETCLVSGDEAAASPANGSFQIVASASSCVTGG